MHAPIRAARTLHAGVRLTTRLSIENKKGTAQATHLPISLLTDLRRYFLGASTHARMDKLTSSSLKSTEKNAEVAAQIFSFTEPLVGQVQESQKKFLFKKWHARRLAK
jgi:hypothetical protein